MKALALSLTHVPHDHKVSIYFSPKRHQILVVARKGEPLDPLFVELNTIEHLTCLEIPDDEGSLEAGISDLLS